MSLKPEEVDRLIAELIAIGRRDGFLSMQPGGKFNQECRHIRAREIGERLNTVGGMSLMQTAGYRVADALGPIPARELEAAWVGIGTWY